MADKNVAEDFESVKADLAKLQSDVTALMESLSATGKEKLDRTRAEATERLRESADEASEHARAMGATLEKQYEEKPLLFLIGAFLLGILLGRSKG